MLIPSFLFDIIASSIAYSYMSYLMFISLIKIPNLKSHPKINPMPTALTESWLKRSWNARLGVFLSLLSYRRSRRVWISYTLNLCAPLASGVPIKMPKPWCRLKLTKLEARPMKLNLAGVRYGKVLVYTHSVIYIYFLFFKGVKFHLSLIFLSYNCLDFISGHMETSHAISQHAETKARNGGKGPSGNRC